MTALLTTKSSTIYFYLTSIHQAHTTGNLKFLIYRHFKNIGSFKCDTVQDYLQVISHCVSYHLCSNWYQESGCCHVASKCRTEHWHARHQKYDNRWR